MNNSMCAAVIQRGPKEMPGSDRLNRDAAVYLRHVYQFVLIFYGQKKFICKYRPADGWERA